MKKFFKILMVFALLSGAALSCTKDYSKEIADVQKQNQELDGLIAALQNALNSTNTTVSQISALTGKNEADIAALVSANAEAFAEIVATHAGDVEYLKGLIAALETAGVKQGEELKGAIDALKIAQDKALADAIAALEAKDAAAAKVAADALAAAKAELEKTITDGDAAAKKKAQEVQDALDEAVAKLEKAITDGDDAAKKAAVEAAQEALDAAVKELKEKIESDDKAVAETAQKALDEAYEKLDGKIDTEIAALKTALEKKINEEDAKFTAAIAAQATKTDADIAALKAEIDAALDNKADKTDVEAKYQALTGMITALQGGLAAAQADIEKFIIDFKAHEGEYNEFKSFAEENFKIQADDINAVKGRLDKLEEMLSDYPTVKSQVAANKAGMEANAAEIEQLKKDTQETQEQVDKLEAQVKSNKDACDAAIEEINQAIKTLKEQVDVLSARLTNIVAAPAKTVEMLSVTIGDSTFVNLQMDFKVAPAAFAKVIADGVESGDVTVALNVTSGYTRTKGNAVSKDIDTLVTPFKVVSTKDGIISVTANLSGIVKTPVVNALTDIAFAAPVGGFDTNKIVPYVSIIVSGTDYEGMTYERISDPVRPIENTINHGDNILTALEWFKDGKPVAKVEDTGEAVKAIKAVNEKKDTAVANNGHLKVVLADIDWKTYGTFSNTNVLEGYELMIPVGQKNPFNKPISIKEIAEMLNIDYDVFAPYFVKPINKGTLTIGYRTQIEWTGYPYAAGEQTQAEKKLFTANNPKGIEIGIGVGKLPEGTNAEQAEFVGLWYEVTSNKIVYGKVDTLDQYDVYVVQRIGKHVSNQEVANPLTVPFAYNAGDPDTYTADHSNKKFTAVAWKGETDIARHTTGSRLVKKGDNYTDENYVKYGGDYATATVTATSSQTKFADIQFENIPFQDKVQEYELVWLFEPYINTHDVQAEDYLDYINVTVAPYHETVKVVTNQIVDYVPMTAEKTFNTKFAVSGVLNKDKSWFDPQEYTTANQNAWITWYSERFGDENNTIYADTLGKKVDGYYTKDKKVSLGWVNNFLNVTFKPVPAGFAGEYNVHAVDTIDNVIAFDYIIPIKALPIGANVAVRAGFPVDPTTNLPVINVGGSVDGEDNYVIDKINPENYFDFVKLNEIATNDKSSLSVGFTATDSENIEADVTFIDDETSTTPATPNAGTTSALKPDVTISWGNYKGTEFAINATPFVNNIKIQDSTSVLIKTEVPVKFDESSKNLELTRTPGQDLEINALAGLRIEGIATKGEVVAPGQPAKTSWSNVLDADGELRTEAYDGGNYVNYGLAENPVFKKITVTVGGVVWTPQQYESILTKNDAGYNFTFKPESGIGVVVITLDYEWNYNFGKVPFQRVITIK